MALHWLARADFGADLCKDASMTDEASTQPGGEPPHESVAMTCVHCTKVAMHEVAGRAYWDGINYATNEPDAPPTEWRLLQCQKCWQISVDLREDFGIGFDMDEALLVYPAARRLSLDVPEGLRNAWTEAQICFSNKTYSACAAMVRRTLEGTCKESGVNESNLYKAVARMKENGTIDDTLSDWADMLRLVGNEGAHYSDDELRREDVEDALSFVEALLDHIYVLRKRFTAFKARRMSGP